MPFPKDQVPSHVIDKAIAKAEGGAGEEFQPALYEGLAPGGAMVLISALTDNPNRTFGEIRGVFSKCKAKLGTQGSVSHSFEHCALFVFPGEDEEAARIKRLGCDPGELEGVPSRDDEDAGRV